MTGQRLLSFVLLCDLNSDFSPFFWSSNLTLTYSAFSARSGSLCLILFLFDVKNVMHPRVIIFVCPGVGVWTNSQDLIAKKKAAISKSTAWSSALLMMEKEARRAKNLKSFGVIAFWTFLGAEMRSSAFNCLLMSEIHPWVTSPCRWKGLDPKRSRCVKANERTASLTVFPAIGFWFSPVTFPDLSNRVIR